MAKTLSTVSPTLGQGACAVLNEPTPEGKARLGLEIAKQWQSGELEIIGTTAPPSRPARPPKPEFLSPRNMPKRKVKGTKGRIALMHAIAHIELNAIDLAWDIIELGRAHG